MDLHTIADQHDQLKQALQLQIQGEKHQPINDHPQALLKQIEQWKMETIERVTMIATELSAKVNALYNRKQEYDQLENRIEQLKKELQEQQEMESFVETDIRQWKTQLEQIKTDLYKPSTAEQSPPQLQIQSIDWTTIIKINETGRPSGM